MNARKAFDAVVQTASVATRKPHLYKGCHPRHGFLHIGKIGGTSIQKACRQLVTEGYQPPMVFQHQWKLSEIAWRYPKVRISFLVRDPLERVVSAFQTTLRQGRPPGKPNASVEGDYMPWLPTEATAYALFKDVRSYLHACISDDDYEKSAANFASRAINHIARGYRYHFGSPEQLEKLLPHIELVRHLDDYDAFLAEMLERCGIPRTETSRFASVKHNAGYDDDPLAELSSSQKERLRDYFAAEYVMYERLSEVTSQR